MRPKRGLQIDLRTVGLLIALHALYAHCLVVMGRATDKPPSWLLRETEWRMESILLGLFAFGSYAIWAAYISAWWRRWPRHPHRPMLAASMTCLALIGVWTWLMHAGAGYAMVQWNGEPASATSIAAAKALAAAFLGIGAILAVYFATHRTRPDSSEGPSEAAPTAAAQRKFPLVACLWLPWILLVGLLFANQIIELREEARTRPPMGHGVGQNGRLLTPAPSGQPPATNGRK